MNTSVLALYIPGISSGLLLSMYVRSCCCVNESFFAYRSECISMVFDY